MDLAFSIKQEQVVVDDWASSQVLNGEVLSLDCKTDLCYAFLENYEILWGVTDVLDQRTLIYVLLLKVKYKEVLVILWQIVKVVYLR